MSSLRDYPRSQNNLRTHRRHRNHNDNNKGRSPSGSRRSKMSKTSRNGYTYKHGTPTPVNNSKMKPRYHHKSIKSSTNIAHSPKHHSPKHHSPKHHSDSSPKSSKIKTKYRSKKQQQKQPQSSSKKKSQSVKSMKTKAKRNKGSSRRRRAYQYKSLKEIIEKLTTKSKTSSFPHTNTAKETLITYYQTFTSAQELMDELENRFFSVLPVEKEDESTRPYISDTDSISELNFTYNDCKNGDMDESTAYCIQVRVINLLTFWMKQYFMSDFEHEPNMIDRLNSFVFKIKNLKIKQRLPSIPIDDKDYEKNPKPPLKEQINNDSNYLIQSTPKKNYDAVSPINWKHHQQPKQIQSYHHHNHNHNHHHHKRSKVTLIHQQPKLLDEQTVNTMCTDTMEQIGKNISPIPPTPLAQSQHVNEEPSFRLNIYDEMKYDDDTEMIIISDDKNNTVTLSPNSLFLPNEIEFFNDNINNETCVVIKGINDYHHHHNNKEDETFQIMLRNINDYNDMNYYKTNNYDDTQKLHQREENKNNVLQFREKSHLLKSSAPNHKFGAFGTGHSKTSNESDNIQNKEVRENIASTPKTVSTNDQHEDSMASFKIEESKNTDINSFDGGSNMNNNNNPNKNSMNGVGFLNVNKNNNNHNQNNHEQQSHKYQPNGIHHNNKKKNMFKFTYYVRDPAKYRGLADKIEKVLIQQQRTARTDTKFIHRKFMRNSMNKKMLLPTMGSAKLIRDRFEADTEKFKQDFLNFKIKNDIMAQQITRMTFSAFKKVRKREFIDQAWKSKERWELAANLCQLIDHFNCISRWVQITILYCTDVKRRGRMIKKFIKIMDKLLELNNFQSLCAVYGAITSSSIYSLETAWSYVPDKHKQRFEEIKYYFITANNMQNLRLLHKQRHPPMIPYTGIYLQDLIQTEERFKDKLSREEAKNYTNKTAGGVVFEHLTKISKQIDDILVYAKTPYDNIKDDHTAQKYLLSEFSEQQKYTDDEIYNISANVSKADG